jgi:hypothetical protein
VKSTTSLSEFRESSIVALTRVESVGIRWKDTRFGRYLDVATRVASEGLDHLTGSGDGELLVEAVGQLRRLQRASTLVGHVDKKVIKHKLGESMKGDDLPQTDEERDHPRNTLFELFMAAELRARGWTIKLGQDWPDVVARHLLRGSLWVECKRPSNDGRALESGLRKAAKRARERLPLPTRTLAAVAVDTDRATGLAGQLVISSGTNESDRLLEAALSPLEERLKGRLRKKDPELAPSIRALLLVQSPVFVLSSRTAFDIPTHFRHVRTDEDRADCQERMHAAIERTLGPQKA